MSVSESSADGVKGGAIEMGPGISSRIGSETDGKDDQAENCVGEKNGGVSMNAEAREKKIDASDMKTLAELLAPLFGSLSRANMSIVSRELKRSVNQELGNPCPFLPDVFSRGAMKILAGGLLASVAAVIIWKIIKYSGKKPADSTSERSTTRNHKPSSAASRNRRLQSPRSEDYSAYIPGICPLCGLPKRTVASLVKKNPLIMKTAGTSSI